MPESTTRKRTQHGQQENEERDGADLTIKSIKHDMADSPASKLDNSQDLEGMGEFEDPFGDELLEDDDDDGEVVISPDLDGEDDEIESHQMEDEEAMQQEEELNVYLPGQKLENDHVLVPDNNAYEMLHNMGVEWPCLSFDILRDNLGTKRETFPATAYLVSGSQADKPADNKIYVMKVSQLGKTKEADEDMDEDSDDGIDEDPILEYKTIPHFGGVNRTRVMPHPESHIVSTWSEAGKVHIWDLTQHVLGLDTPGIVLSKNPQPMHTIDQHNRIEGYAMDWSRTSVGRLLTGDLNGRVFLTSKTETSFVTEAVPFTGHEGSVEDLQWSPVERDVFASAGVDGHVRIWDVREKKPVLSVRVHDVDVNVISWNRSVSHLLASGSDSGEFSVWDLKMWSNTAKPIPAASFKWHTGAITSIEWHPTESSMLAASGEDEQITLWDLALEADREEQIINPYGQNGKEVIVPPQLLFIHQGQKSIKELHFHEQVNGMIVSTSADGFNLFKTINS